MLKEDALKLATELLQLHNLNEWQIKFDNAKRRAGVCIYSTKIIKLSTLYIQSALDEDIKNTLLHEIAHALVGIDNGHNDVWRYKALAIGCTAERCCKEFEIPTNIKKYKGTCPNCKEVFEWLRKPKYGINTYICTRENCKGKKHRLIPEHYEHSSLFDTMIVNEISIKMFGVNKENIVVLDELPDTLTEELNVSAII